MVMIKLETCDGKVIDANLDVIRRFRTIKTMIDDCGMDCDEGTVIPVPNVNSDIMTRILNWAEYHKNDPEPNEMDDSDRKSDNIDPWDRDFLKVDQGTLFELVLAANYLDIKDLLSTACKTVANLIQGKTAAEIRRTFNIRNDFDHDECVAINRQNKMLDE